MTRSLDPKQLKKVWPGVALPAEEIRYAFIANPPGAAQVELSQKSKQMAGMQFSAVGALAAGSPLGSTVARSGSQLLPIAPVMVIAVGSQRLRVWRATSKGKPEELTGEVSYPAIASVQVKKLDLRVAYGRVKAGEVTVTFGDRSRACFETDLDIAETFAAMLPPVIGGTNAVREESLTQRRAVAQLQNRVAALRAGA